MSSNAMHKAERLVIGTFPVGMKPTARKGQPPSGRKTFLLESVMNFDGEASVLPICLPETRILRTYPRMNGALSLLTSP